MNTLPFPEQPWNVANLRTIPWLQQQSWKGLGKNAQDSLYGHGSLFLKLDKPDPAGNVLLLILVVSDGSQRNRAETEYVCIGIQPGVYLRDLYPLHDWSPWPLRPYYHESLVGDYDEVRLRFLELIEDFGWPEELEAEDNDVPYERFMVRDPDHFYGSTPAPGESVEEYEDRLLWGEPDTGNDNGICRDFIRTKTGAYFVRGGHECFGQELCHWHNNMDAIYAAGSSTIAGHEVPLEVLADAIELLERCAVTAEEGKPNWCEPQPYAAAHARCLLAVMKAALAAEPSEEPQAYEG